MTKDQDFRNASLVAKVPIELVINTIATILLIFSITSVVKTAGNVTIDEVPTIVVELIGIFIVYVPFIVMFWATLLALTTGKTDINFDRSFRLTWRLQRSMVRQVGSNVAAQGKIAELSNIRRLSSFVWVRNGSPEIIIAIRQDLRSDVNSIVDKKALDEIAEDLAMIENKTYTGFTIKIINDKFLFSHYKRYEVASLI